MQMPHGYRWIVEEDFDRSEEVQALFRPFMGGTIVPWDCMVEFGFDHDHDPQECEQLLADMMSGDSGDPDLYVFDDIEYKNYMYGSSRY